MNKYNDLLTRISNEYAIVKGKSEQPNQYKARIIYSLLGRMALASLFDRDEEDLASIVHMKKRIESVLISYKEMYPEISREVTDEVDQLADEIYGIYLNTGCIYHEPNHVAIAAPASATDIDSGLTLTRGQSLDFKQRISGLGTYQVNSPLSDRYSIPQMFMMDETPLIQKWERCIQSAIWNRFDGDTTVEYLRIVPPFKRGYWVDKPDISGTISMLRTGLKGSLLYYLYRYENGKCFVSQLPQWETEGYNYRALANACLSSEGVLPKTTYRIDGNIVYLSFGYLPPPAELYLWKLYTWPISMQNFPRDFSRICDRKVFDCIRAQMERTGYGFIEE